jgi:hypothetical protein
MSDAYDIQSAVWNGFRELGLGVGSLWMQEPDIKILVERACVEVEIFHAKELEELEDRVREIDSEKDIAERRLVELIDERDEYERAANVANQVAENARRREASERLRAWKVEQQLARALRRAKRAERRLRVALNPPAWKRRRMFEVANINGGLADAVSPFA